MQDGSSDKLHRCLADHNSLALKVNIIKHGIQTFLNTGKDRPAFSIVRGLPSLLLDFVGSDNVVETVLFAELGGDVGPELGRGASF